MNPKFFNKSAMGTAWQAQKDQPFGKDNLRQVFTTERAFPHLVFPILKEECLDSDDMKNLFTAMSSLQTLWNKYQQVKDINWTPLREHNLNWKDQAAINNTRVNMRTAMLFHYNLDLAAVHWKTGGNHVAAHWTANPEIILQQVQGVMDQKNYDHLKCMILIDNGCPNVFLMKKQHMSSTGICASTEITSWWSKTSKR
jgi:hypothetical protein